MAKRSKASQQILVIIGIIIPFIALVFGDNIYQQLTHRSIFETLNGKQVTFTPISGSIILTPNVTIQPQSISTSTIEQTPTPTIDFLVREETAHALIRTTSASIQTGLAEITVGVPKWQPISIPPIYEQEDKPDDYDQRKCDWLSSNFPQSLEDIRLSDIFPVGWPINPSHLSLIKMKCPNGTIVMQGAAVMLHKNSKSLLEVPQGGCIDVFGSTASITGESKEIGKDIFRVYSGSVYTDLEMNYYPWCNEVDQKTIR